MNTTRRLLAIALALGALVSAGCAAAGGARRSAGNLPAGLTYLAGPMAPEDLDRLRRDAPDLRVTAGASRDEALRLAPEVDGADGRYCTDEFLRAATKLRWVQAQSAGVERYLALPGLRGDDRIVLTNMKAVHGPTIADHAFAMLLVLTRRLDVWLDPARRGTWDRSVPGAEPIALEGRTLLVVGLGGIGTEVARRGKGFGMRVLAVRRSDATPPPFVDRQAAPAALGDLLAEADVVAVCVPLTAETRGLIGERELALMRPGSFLVNVARGEIVDTAALTRALAEGGLAGACLDVTDPEPLPPDHPLWGMPNVLITPHVSARSALTEERRRAVMLENLRRFAAGEALLNVVDKEAGY